MKIAFWSGQEQVGTTFNTTAIACTAAMVYPITIGVVSSGYCNRDLEKNFQGKKQEGKEKPRHLQPGGALLAAEQEEYFPDSGLDCLLRKEQEGELDGRLIQASMQPVIEGRLYCMPGCQKEEYKRWYKDRLFAQMHRIMEGMEAAFDVVFVDCGNRKDDFTQKILRQAELCVLNMDQGEELIGDYYRMPPQFLGKAFFLVGNYFKEELYNRTDLERLYRMDGDMLGAIPYNPQMQAASKAGMMDIGMKKYIRHGMKGKDVDFEREVLRSARLILKSAGVVK